MDLVKTKKNSGIPFQLLKIILLIGVGVVCYFQFQKLSAVPMENVEIESAYFLFICLLLLPVNYFFEWMKWKTILRSFDTDFGIRTNFQAFLAGIITGMLTPNMQGNFLGRIYYYPRRYRVQMILMTLWTNFAQFVITLLLGITAFYSIGISEVSFVDAKPWFLLLGGALLTVYLLFGRLKVGFNRIKVIQKFDDLLDRYPIFRYEVLAWGILRHLTFSLQFLVVLAAFGGGFTLENYLLIWQLYFWTTIAPSLILGKLFIRESIALWVLVGVGLNEWELVLSSLIIWGINLVIPSILGLLICKRSQLQ